MHVTYQTLGHNSAVTREMRIGPEKRPRVRECRCANFAASIYLSV